jgi:dihydrofolate synthase/folylpolyglutamate synthase
LLRLCEREHIPATFFELTTALAFHHFGQPAPHGPAAGNASSRRSGKCDAVVLEVGLGGRLDATNVLTNSQTVLSVITSVQMDHTKILGNTIELIAREKAGIMKPGVDVLVGRDTPKEVLQVVGPFIDDIRYCNYESRTDRNVQTKQALICLQWTTSW